MIMNHTELTVADNTGAKRVTRELRAAGHTKIISLAPEVI